MTIDNIIREKCIKELAKVQDLRESCQDKNDSISNKRWNMLNYANAFVLNKLPLDINHEEVDRYRRQKDFEQYELDFDTDINTNISDKPQLVYYGDFQVLIPAGYDLGFYKRVKE